MKNVPGIQDVAKKAGVSISTVSRVLNNSGNVGECLKKKVYEAVEATGYSANPIASNLKSTKRNQIAIVIPDLQGTYYTDIIKGSSEYFYEKGIMSVILESNGDLKKEASIMRDLEKQWIDGVILIPGRTGEDAQYRQYMEHLSRMRKRDTAIPVVLVEAGDCGAGLDQVCVDHEAAFACLAEHLLELGRRRIAFLGDCGGAPMSQQELSGIRKVLDTAGCGLPDSLVNMGNSTVRDGFQAMETLLLEGAKPDGVICANDQVAAGALGACKEHGLSVPADIAVTGYGGMALSIVTDPAITTMIAPRRRLGSRAAELLYERIEGMSGGPRREILTAHAAVRCSTMRSATRGLETMFDD